MDEHKHKPHEHRLGCYERRSRLRLSDLHQIVENVVNDRLKTGEQKQKHPNKSSHVKDEHEPQK